VLRVRVELMHRAKAREDKILKGNAVELEEILNAAVHAKRLPEGRDLAVEWVRGVSGEAMSPRCVWWFSMPILHLRRPRNSVRVWEVWVVSVARAGRAVMRVLVGEVLVWQHPLRDLREKTGREARVVRQVPRASIV
jgi:hypothetical protein